MPLMSRERIVKAVRHEETDYIPIDPGGRGISVIAVEPYRGLYKALDI